MLLVVDQGRDLPRPQRAFFWLSCDVPLFPMYISENRITVIWPYNTGCCYVELQQMAYICSVQFRFADVIVVSLVSSLWSFPLCVSSLLQLLLPEISQCIDGSRTGDSSSLLYSYYPLVPIYGRHRGRDVRYMTDRPTIRRFLWTQELLLWVYNERSNLTFICVSSARIHCALGILLSRVWTWTW